MAPFSLGSVLGRPSSVTTWLSTSTRLTATSLQEASAASHLTSRPFSYTPQTAINEGINRSLPIRRSKRMLAERDPKIRIMDKAMYKLKFVPPPLRMGRNRYLRHWTIHRAWLLFRRQQRESRERELMQQYQSIHNACEELRLSRGPGLRDEGYLYRVAMEKKGVYRHGGVPIEYARPQTDTPARLAWNHGWQR
ncbi:hypothetical protein SEPCBS119000_003532 [Sporothrix epigloea]|uniref:Large ribosomal subunit protein mL40 n=1 Tax=Sporothrix epigloea TaxID=1892477 RepID=A0ABP0DPY4_9PEZI